MAVGRRGVSMRIQIGGVLFGLLAAGAIFYFDWSQHYRSLLADEAKWEITGAPGSSVSKDVFDKTPNPLAVDEYAVKLKLYYDDLYFQRSSGDSYCNAVLRDRSIFLQTNASCQFTHPAKLHVQTPSGDFYFLTGTSPATVTYVDDKPVCVLGGWYRRGSHPDGAITQGGSSS